MRVSEERRGETLRPFPLVLLGLGMAFTPLPKGWLFVAVGVYYVVLLFRA